MTAESIVPIIAGFLLSMSLWRGGKPPFIGKFLLRVTAFFGLDLFSEWFHQPLPVQQHFCLGKFGSKGSC